MKATALPVEVLVLRLLRARPGILFVDVIEGVGASKNTTKYALDCLLAARRVRREFASTGRAGRRPYVYFNVAAERGT